MQYHFNDTDAFAAFLAIWRAQLVGRTLTACFRPVATYESLPDHFDDGLVLCTTTIEMAIFVNTSGAQASFGRFPVNLDQPDHLLSRHHIYTRNAVSSRVGGLEGVSPPKSSLFGRSRPPPWPRPAKKEVFGGGKAAPELPPRNSCHLHISAKAFCWLRTTRRFAATNVSPTVSSARLTGWAVRRSIAGNSSKETARAGWCW